VELHGSVEVNEENALISEPAVDKRDEGNDHQDHD
jgi:hypothetical protein